MRFPGEILIYRRRGRKCPVAGYSGKIIRGRGKTENAQGFNRCNKTSRTPLPLFLSFSLVLSLSACSTTTSLSPLRSRLSPREKNEFTVWLSDRAVDSTRLSIYVYILVLRETSIIRVVTPYLYTQRAREGETPADRMMPRGFKNGSTRSAEGLNERRLIP